MWRLGAGQRGKSGVSYGPMAPATDWKEVVAPDEQARFEALAAQLGALQKRHATSGVFRRALHAKANLVAYGKFEVLPDIPDHAKQALFAEPRTYPAVVRFSNGSGEIQKDSTPDVRGIAVKLIGVPGKKVIPGMEDCVTQDFLGILSGTVPFRTPEEFVWVVTNAAVSPALLVPRAVLHFGPSRAFHLLGSLQRSLARRVSSLAGNHYFGALPMRYGPYAVKFTLAPVDVSPASTPPPDHLGEALARELEAGPVSWDFKVQFYIDEYETPLEDPTTDWASPWERVGRLTLPRQSVTSERGAQLANWAEQLSFDPWHAQDTLRPLGAMMRSRGPAYLISTRARHAAPEPTEFPLGLEGDAHDRAAPVV